MSKNHLQRILVALVSLFMIFSSCSFMFAKPALKGTTWKAVQEMFVADAGTMTINHTLVFISAREVVVKYSSYLPSYPAMYMNPDGTIDTMPGMSNETEETCGYTFKHGILAVTRKSGGQEILHYELNGTFTRKESWGEVVVYKQVKEEKEK